jgi:hypothetical protein
MPLNDLSSVYLIEVDDQPERSLKNHWAEIFEEMLLSWCAMSAEWPPRRTYSILREWFEIEIQELVFDLADGPILQEF